MLWQPIACGANGLISFGFHRILQHMAGAERDAFFERYCVTAREIARFFDVILSVESAPTVTDVPSALRARSWRLGGETYVLVVNTTRERQQAQLRLSQRFGRGEAVLHEGAALKGANRLDVSLPPLGIVMMKLK